MKRISATAASRGFADLLDSVERDGATFVIERHGRAVATISPCARANGRSVKEVLAEGHGDPTWMAEIEAVRDLVEDRAPAWSD